MDRVQREGGVPRGPGVMRADTEPPQHAALRASAKRTLVK